MVIAIHELVDQYGAAVDRHVAAILVGAGLSMQAGLPSWSALIHPLLAEIGLREPPTDLPLAAEYYVQSAPGGRDRLERHLADELSRVSRPSEGHNLVTELGVPEIWTTNFDPLLERANAAAQVINIDCDAMSIGTGLPVVIKVHGGFDVDGTTARWKGKPVITRSDFERYEVEHPRLWSLLQASYLTRTMLFLGFSFTDPNIELLLRLARRQGTAAGNHHYTVMRRPADPAEIAEHDLRVRDLETNGVAVCEIDHFDDMVPLLRSIKRRTRPNRLFVSGSGDDSLRGWCDRIGMIIGRHRTWELASLGGEAGLWTTMRVGIQRRAEDVYDPEVLRLYFRRREGSPPPPMPERTGTAVFSDHDRHPLVDQVIEECRALVVLGGGDRTREEVDFALDEGLGVVPIAASGGFAYEAWRAASAPEADSRRRLLGGRVASSEVWARLAHDDPYLVEQAASTLLEQAMYWP